MARTAGEATRARKPQPRGAAGATTTSDARATQAAADAPADDQPVPERPLGRVLSPAQFWQLMERWGVPDTAALKLIDYPGKPGASGKRPRFRFSTRQQRITSFLPEIDAALAAARETAGWLHKRNRAVPFGGRTPLDFMIAGDIAAMADVLRFLHRAVLRTAAIR